MSLTGKPHVVPLLQGRAGWAISPTWHRDKLAQRPARLAHRTSGSTHGMLAFDGSELFVVDPVRRARMDKRSTERGRERTALADGEPRRMALSQCRSAEH